MDAVVSITFPLASIVIVLFLLWNDLLRRRRTFRALLFVRAFMCLALGVVLIFNWVTYRARLQDLPVTFVLIGAVVALVGAAWFLYRGIRGDQGFVAPREEPLPRIFDATKGESSEEARLRDGDE